MVDNNRTSNSPASEYDEEILPVSSTHCIDKLIEFWLRTGSRMLSYLWNSPPNEHKVVGVGFCINKIYLMHGKMFGLSAF